MESASLVQRVKEEKSGIWNKDTKKSEKGAQALSHTYTRHNFRITLLYEKLRPYQSGVMQGSLSTSSCLDAITDIYYFMFDKVSIASVYFKKLLATGSYFNLYVDRLRLSWTLILLRSRKRTH